MDNRFKFPESSEIDFVHDVGLTGQDHDNYAEPGTLPRFDWIKIIILGLLANQASGEKPTQYRPGTLYYNLNTFLYECAKDGDFESLAKCIKIANLDLHDWSQDIETKRQRFYPSGTFSGVAHHKSNVINIPRSLQDISKSPNQPYLFKNGKITNPSFAQFNSGCPVAIELSGSAVLQADDTFTVFIR